MVVVVFGTSAILPTMLQSLLGYPVLATGWLMMPRGLGNLIAAGFAGRLANRVDPRLMMLTGMGLMAVMLWQMSAFDLNVGSQTIMLNGLIQGMGMGLVFLPLTTTTFTTLDRRYRAEGTSMFALIRNLGSLHRRVHERNPAGEVHADQPR